MNKNSIYKYYYYLAAINLVTICSTIWIADRIHNIYTETIKASQEWNHRISLHEELETIIIHGNGPGNNIFISNNLEFEKKNFDTILINFDKKIDEIEVDNLNFKNNDEVIINISKLKELVQIATSSTFQIFDYYKKNDIPKASFYMAKMDESFHLAILKTIEIRKILRNLKNKELIKRQKKLVTYISKKYH